jgi:hypothetical protein
MKRLAIESGAVALVPLSPAGFAVCVVVRADGRGRAVGAFFGPKVGGALDVKASELRLDSALLVCRFGDHGLHSHRWRVIGAIPKWDNAPWAVRRFSRHHENPGLCYVTEYDDSSNVIAERVLPAAEGRELPADAQYGSAVVEAKLSKLLQ